MSLALFSQNPEISLRPYLYPRAWDNDYKESKKDISNRWKKKADRVSQDAPFPA